MSKRTSIATVAFAVALSAAAVAYAQDKPRTPYRLARDSGCLICHEVEAPPRSANDVIPNAPEFEAIACRYRSDPNAATGLASTVLNGSGPRHRDRHWSGKAGFESMYPNDEMLDAAQARQIVDWIMTLCPGAAKTDGHRARRG